MTKQTNVPTMNVPTFPKVITRFPVVVTTFPQNQPKPTQSAFI
jgi:hypothetical protein